MNDWIITDIYNGNATSVLGATEEQICEFICRRAGLTDFADAKEAIENWMDEGIDQTFDSWQSVYECFQDHNGMAVDPHRYDPDPIICCHFEEASPSKIEDLLKTLPKRPDVPIVAESEGIQLCGALIPGGTEGVLVLDPPADLVELFSTLKKGMNSSVVKFPGFDPFVCLNRQFTKTSRPSEALKAEEKEDAKDT